MEVLILISKQTSQVKSWLSPNTRPSMDKVLSGASLSPQATHHFFGAPGSRLGFPSSSFSLLFFICSTLGIPVPRVPRKGCYLHLCLPISLQLLSPKRRFRKRLICLCPGPCKFQIQDLGPKYYWEHSNKSSVASLWRSFNFMGLLKWKYYFLNFFFQSCFVK